MIESLKKFLNITPEDLKKPVFTKSKGDVFYLILNTKANTFTNWLLKLQFKIKLEYNEVEI